MATFRRPIIASVVCVRDAIDRRSKSSLLALSESITLIAATALLGTRFGLTGNPRHENARRNKKLSYPEYWVSASLVTVSSEAIDSDSERRENRIQRKRSFNRHVAYKLSIKGGRVTLFSLYLISRLIGQFQPPSPNSFRPTLLTFRLQSARYNKSVFEKLLT